jgi:hypothetical protein
MVLVFVRPRAEKYSTRLLSNSLNGNKVNGRCVAIRQQGEALSPHNGEKSQHDRQHQHDDETSIGRFAFNPSSGA